MDLEEELSNTLTTELARELIIQDHGKVDEQIFADVMRHITGPTGSQNAFDAPIIYKMVLMMRGNQS